MSKLSMIRASTALSKSGAKWMSQAVDWPLPLAGTGAKPIATHRDGRSSNLRLAVVAGLLVKHEDSPGILTVAKGSYGLSPSVFRDATGTIVEFDLGDLVHTAVAVLRSHPHINNVFTHLCGGKWERIGQALRVILNPLATLNDLSPLAQNIVELMCAERGITGRILKPYFHVLLAKVLPPRTAAYLRAHVLRLFHEMEARDAHLSQGAAEPDNRVAMQGAA